jgi:hypothetical protein
MFLMYIAPFTMTGTLFRVIKIGFLESLGHCVVVTSSRATSQWAESVARVSAAAEITGIRQLPRLAGPEFSFNVAAKSFDDEAGLVRG